MSDAAVLAQLDGNVLLRAQILADGSVAKVSFVRGLPCGLTDEALKAIKTGLSSLLRGQMANRWWPTLQLK